MKSLLVTWKSIAAMFMLCLIQVMSWGQDNPDNGSSTTVKTSTTEHTEWYAAPWVWIVGGAIVILLLVALLSGGRGSSSRTTVTDVGGGTRTITTDTDEV